MRDYFQEQLPQFRTPRLEHHAIGVIPDCGVACNVSMWVCSKDNSMDQAKWYFAVQVNHLDGDHKDKTATHFFLDERDAWLFRAKKLGNEPVQMVTDFRQLMRGNTVVTEGAIVTPDFSERSYWEGYLAAEVLNLID